MDSAGDIEKFYSWARQLAIPQSKLPSKTALETILKSPQRDLFLNALEKIRTIQEVSKLRKNILIDKLTRNDDCVSQISEKHLSNEVKKSVKLSKIKATKVEVQNNIEKSKEKSKLLLNEIQNKNLLRGKHENIVENLRIKTNLYEIKCDAFDKKLENEVHIKKKINKSMPVEASNSKIDTEKSLELINQAINILENCYKENDCNMNNPLTKDIQSNLWSQLKQILNQMPAYTIFNTVLKLTEEKIQTVLSLKSNVLSVANESNSSNSEFSDMEKEVLKSQMSILVSAAKFASMKRTYKQNFDKFTEGFHAFFDSVKSRVEMFNNILSNSEDIDKIISDYITQYNTITYKKMQNEDLRKEIELCKSKVLQNKQLIDNDSITFVTLKDIYNNIQNSANKIQYEILGMSQIKDKISFWKNTIAGEFISMKQKNNRLQSSFMNSSVGLVGRMDITNSTLDLTAEQGEGVFSSTKLDNDATLSVTLQKFGDISMFAQKRFTMPNHVLEILTFSELPISCFQNIFKDSLYHIDLNVYYGNDFINPFPSVLTNKGLIYDFKSLKLWSNEVNTLLKPQLPLIDFKTVDQRKLKSNVDEQNQKLAEVFDKINTVFLKNSQILKSASRIYKFVEENPLKKYVPKSRRYKNLPYEEYENEFIMYYRICKK